MVIDIPLCQTGCPLRTVHCIVRILEECTLDLEMSCTHGKNVFFPWMLFSTFIVHALNGSAIFTILDMVTYEACDVSLITTAPGILASPGRLANIKYLNDMNCIYNITLQGPCVSKRIKMSVFAAST